MHGESRPLYRLQMGGAELSVPEKRDDATHDQTEHRPVLTDQGARDTNTKPTDQNIQQTTVVPHRDENVTEKSQHISNGTVLSKQEHDDDDDDTVSLKHDKDIMIALEQDSSIEISQGKIIAPDGGWGWFVVLASFIVNVLVDGTIATFGFFYPYLESEYQSSPAVTSLAGSLVPTIFLMSAPIVGALIHRFDCRKVSVVGGVIAMLGLAAASFCTNIAGFAVFYGVIGGIGIGMNSLSSHLIVNTYFNKKRGIANGIVSSGAGLGVFMLAPFLQYLLENYSWRGTMLIYSGCVLQFCVCGVLLRPLSPYHTSSSETPGSDSDSQETSSSETDQGFSQPEQPLIKNHKMVAVNVEGESHTMPKIFHSQEVCQKPVHLRKYFASMFHMNKDNPPSVFRKSLPDLSKSRDADHVYSYQNLDLNEIDVKNIKQCHGTKTHTTDNTNSRLLNPLDRKDIFYSGSIYNIHEYQKAGSMADFINNMAEVETIETSSTDVDDDYRNLNKSKRTSFRRRIRSLTSRLIDVSVFRCTVYVPVLLSGVFLQMGQFIPLTFLPNYCYSIGLVPSDVTIIVAIFGIANIFGRLSAGCLANVECISTLWLCTFGNFMCGVVCALFPFCNTLETLCMYAGGFGYFIGYFCPLQVIIMVEYLGIEKLTSAYGILQLCKGPAALFGPPLAGMVYQMTEDYNIALLVAAALFTLSAIVQATIPIINRFSKKKS